MQPNKEILKPLKFGSRMRKYVLIPYCLDVISKRGTLKEAILKVHMAVFDSSLNDKEFWTSEVSKDLKRSKIEKLREEIERKNRKDVEKYLPILFNQTLIMVCTICDTFLFDLLKVITNKEPNILKSLVNENDITIPEIIDLGNYQKIFDTIQNQVLQRFDFAGIDKKMTILKRLGIDVDSAFKLKFHTRQVQQKYPNGYNFLITAYKKRNDIVHRNKLTVKTHKELEKISVFFGYFISDLALIAGRKFGIPTDLELFFKDPQSVDIDL